MTYVTNFYWNWKKELIGWIGDVTGVQRLNIGRWSAAKPNAVGAEMLIFMTGMPMQDTVRGEHITDADVISGTLEEAVRKGVRQIFEERL